MLERLERWLDLVAEWTGRIVAPLALVYLLVLLYEVFSRYLLNAPTLWAHEVGTYVFAVQFMLGGGFCYARGNMVNIEIFQSMLPRRARALLELLLSPVVVTVLVVMFIYGGKAFVSSAAIGERTSSLLGLPIYPMRAVVPAAAFLLFLQVVRKSIADLRILLEGDSAK